MEEKQEILAAIKESFTQLDQKMTDGFTRVDQRFTKLEKQFDELHQSQIKLEGMRGDFNLLAENVTALANRFAKWDGEGEEETIPVRVSRLEMRVTRLEKKKGRN